MQPKTLEIPLEDELGDVLDKALRLAGLTPEQASGMAGIEQPRLLDALDWRSDLSPEELGKLAQVLRLNEVGLCALASNSYPIAPLKGMPFCLYPLRMAHGIGVANAYLVSTCCSDHAILFDTGANFSALLANWPAAIRSLDAVFITHVETEHAGGLCEVISHFGIKNAFIPDNAKAPCGQPMAEGQVWKSDQCKVTALSTPGHSAAHNSYLVETSCTCSGRKLLIAGDLIYAGSVGCAFYSKEKLFSNVHRVLHSLPPDTLIAPGHGPLTSVATELRFNPFVC
jgi:glyoxylase-like metal-dependent hydrolase (beta-lactamase superfamily II)